MAELSDNTNWSETDANNNKAPPNGWPEGMMPSGVNDSARGDKGALKRFWDRANPVQTVSPASGVYTFATSNIAYPAAYATGEVFSFHAGGASVGGDQFQVNTLGALPIYKINYDGTLVAILAGDIVATQHVRLVYLPTLNAGAGGFLLLDPYLPATGNGAGWQASQQLKLTPPQALEALSISALNTTAVGTWPAFRVITGGLGAPVTIASGQNPNGSSGGYIGVGDGDTVTAGNSSTNRGTLYGLQIAMQPKVNHGAYTDGIINPTSDDVACLVLANDSPNGSSVLTECIFVGRGGYHTQHGLTTYEWGQILGNEAYSIIYIGSTAHHYRGIDFARDGATRAVCTDCFFHTPGGNQNILSARNNADSAENRLLSINANDQLLLANGNLTLWQPSVGGMKYYNGVRSQFVLGDPSNMNGNIICYNAVQNGYALNNGSVQWGMLIDQSTNDFWISLAGTGALLAITPAGQIQLPVSGGVALSIPNSSISVGQTINGANINASGNVNAVNVSASNTLTVNGLQLYNNAAYLYSPSNMRTTGLVVDGDISISGNIGIGQLGTFHDIEAVNDIVAAGVFRLSPATGTGLRGARIECWAGGDWDYMTFVMTGGRLAVSPDNGHSGFYFNNDASFSDARLKTAIRDTRVDALAAILATPVRAFKWNAEGKKLMPRAQPMPIGFIAQELQETMPLAVEASPFDGETLGINHQHLTPYLVRALQQLAERVEILETK